MVDGGVVTGPVVTGCVATGVVTGSVVTGPVVDGCVVAGGWLAGEDGDCTGDDGGGTTVGVADWETAPPFGEGWDDGELGALLVGAGGWVCETGEPQMTLGTTMAAATSTASSPVASNAHARPRRFLRGGWPSPPGGWARKAASDGAPPGWPAPLGGWARKAASADARPGPASAPGAWARKAACVGARPGWPSPAGGWAGKAASVGVRRGTAPVVVGGPPVLPDGGGA